MADERTRRQKIQAMASQDVSPYEAANARAMLARRSETPLPVPASPRETARDAPARRARPSTPDAALRRAKVDAIRRAVDPEGKYATLHFVSSTGQRIRVDL